MQDEFDKPLLRAIQYHYIDGTFELTFGGLCLILGVFFFIQAAMPESIFSALLLMSLVLIIPTGALLKNVLVKRFKERVTYPRTGYVSYPKLQGKDKKIRNRLNLGVRAIVGALMVVLVIISSRAEDWIPALTGFFFAFMLTWVGLRSSLNRFVIMGILVFMTGLIFSFLRFGNLSGLSMFYTTCGLILLISGVVTLWKYLQDNPQPGETDDAG